MKVLFVSHVANFQKFNRPFMEWFRRKGFEVHYASYNDEEIIGADKVYTVDFRRSPYNPRNIKAFFQLVHIFRKEKYDLIHCHTPVGSILARMASVFLPDAKVIYTAHGFHFFEGAPLSYRIIYKNAEKMLAHLTDVLVTVNNEDYAAAKQFRLKKGGRVYRLDGVGVDIEKFHTCVPDKQKLYAEFGLADSDFIITTVAELIKRKNLETALKAFAEAKISNGRYMICGRGPELDNLVALSDKLGIRDKVIFAGYRKDIAEIMKISDLFLFTSHQEGLPIAVIEAMACGLPIIVTDIRGCRELVCDGSGIMVKDNDAAGFADAINKMYSDECLRSSAGNKCYKLSQKYDVGIAVEAMAEIYNTCIKENS